MKTSILEPYWKNWGAISSNGIMCCKIESITRPNEWRIAIWFKDATRWRISQPLGGSLADQVIVEARNDLYRGNYGMVSTRHILWTHRRQTEPSRKLKHKASMEKRFELRAMENMAGFGMF